MSKVKILYACSNCGAQSPKWQGRCGDCGEWNTLEEQRSRARPAPVRGQGYAGVGPSRALGDVDLSPDPRVTTGIGELDRVLGGGLVPGSAILIGGDPGIGKSTLLLMAAAHLSENMPTLYVTGEESLRQVSLRSRRLGLASDAVQLLTETCVESVCAEAARSKPDVLVVDSIQTMYSEALPSAPGTVAQLRESAAQLVRMAKQSGTVVFLVGHVTKEGVIAGPRVLEHMVDTVLYFESEAGSRFRIIRAVKNRFGAANEIGVFAMSESGLKEVRNPSSIFLSRDGESIPGSLVMVAREGTRPFLVEVQALADDSQTSQPRRVTVGLEQNRLSLLLAVLHRHAGLSLHGYDVFVNVVGGVRIGETAADLPALLAVASSFRDRAIGIGTVAFGEVGLAGEIRPVPFGEERIAEAAKQGFKRVLVPNANLPRVGPAGIEVIGVKRLADALEKV